MDAVNAESEQDELAVPTFRRSVAVWARIGILSFGGPTAQIALMHREVVERWKWLTEQQFLGALSFCMLLPGPEAMQLATYAGWKLHGVRGGLVAGLLFVMPGALVVLALSMIYAAFGTVPFVETLFMGIKAAVLVIVIDAFRRIAGRALAKAEHWVIAVLSFLAIFAFDLPFPLIIVLAGAFGFWRGQTSPSGDPAEAAPVAARSGETFKTICIWLAVWLLPLVGLAVWFGRDHVFSELAWFFSKLAVVTFGGAYAVLAYMAQDVVGHYGWLRPGEMLDGLGLAETTPGPLILVTEFVGFLAAYRQGGESAWLVGLVGAVVTLWATFAPCFLWIFAGAPYIEWIAAQPALKGALTAITAAVVGVILNLAVWFGLHVFFGTVTTVELGYLAVSIPDPGSLDLAILGLAAACAVLLFWLKWSVPAVLAASAALALVTAATGL